MNLEFPGLSLIRTPLKYGLIIGFLYSIQINVQHIFRSTYGELDPYSPYLSLIFIFSGMLLGLGEEKKINEENINYGNLLKTALMITAVSAFITGFFM